MAAEVCSFLWKSSSPFNPCFASLSISLGLDYNWYPLVQQCQELRMFSFCFILGDISVDELMMHNVTNFLQLPEEGQKWGFLIWLLFSFCGLLCIAFMCLGKVSGCLLLPIDRCF